MAEPKWQGKPKSSWKYWRQCDNPNCDTWFGTNVPNKVNCCDECRREKDKLNRQKQAVLKHREVTCVICGKKVTPVQANQETCNRPACKRELTNKRSKEKRANVKEVIRVQCWNPDCDNYFTPKNDRHICCSDECRAVRKSVKTKVDRQRRRVALQEERGEPEKTPEYHLDEQKQKTIERAERGELTAFMKQAAMVDNITDAIKHSIQKLTYVPPKKVIKVNKKPEKEDEDAVLLLSDLHIGEEALLSEMGGLNEYNFEIFCERLADLANSIYSFVGMQSKSYNIPTLHIEMLGDNLTGEMIYLGQRNYLDLDLGDQFVLGAEKVVEFIVNMLDVFSYIEIDGVVGNHGRLGKKGESKTHVNFDWLWYKYLESKLEKYGSKIKFNFPKSFFLVKEIRGWDFLLQHGEDINSYLRIPYYGMDRDAKDMRDMLQTVGKDFDYVCYGHFHESETKELVRGERIVNGSFVGGDLFSTKKLRKLSRPSQFFFGVNRKHGISFRYLTYLDKGKPRYKLVREDYLEEEVK